ncbi:MAG: sigma-70 family RNA polymerase sigma factor [Phycisphaerae bacterium]|nr:sigma-70 family RNA polymerase sigma factor [Phycisphaerae bacterium]NIP50588.1 sigma-70 family RNA polymerase sigma factor [Phycisphaerae bacterium]NIS50799.1 sigma-70 family RNA polymerase sigma factor [Phycisphaerae bacterium]NIU07476.1 sigma-70 family RNA polymerase sigma factor [Phycisphaerae bacterium]NIU55066.1 sigma-70 family RNA polymerase sigma factor [Phycisphaerae bacterium]
MNLNSETQLVEAAQNGNLESFGVLYERYHSAMIALAYSVLGNRDLADDAAQETFAVACQKIGTLRRSDKFAFWLAGICRNTARNVLRSKGKDAALTAQSRVEDIEMGAERRDVIRQAVWNLSSAERELIVLRYYNGFSQAQISNVMDISPQAVNGRLVRAKRKIAKYLKRNGFTGVNYGTDI